MKTVGFYTLGCKVNQYETEAISEQLEKLGYKIVPFCEKADYYIINTCSVTAMSDRKSRQMIRRAKKTNPDSIIAVMGCYSQAEPETVLGIDGVNLVLGTKDKGSVTKLLPSISPESKLNAVTDVKDNHTYENLTVCSTNGRTRAYIKIQDGCSQFCSYCIIPYTRGPVRSRSEADILKEVNELALVGYKEIILTGIHVASYGKDLGNTNLADLLNKLDIINGIERIRLSSIEPMALNNDFVEKIKNCKKLCPHFHISLQSGCDQILKRMNRHYTTEQFYEIVLGLRNSFPDCAITTDIMTGFAGETDGEFNQTLEFVKKVQFAECHIFQYSQRKGTPAAKRPDQISPEVKDDRAKKLAQITEKAQAEFLDSHIGRTMSVLFETRTGDNLYEGKTANYITVHAESESDVRGQFKNVLLTKRKNNILLGKTVD